MKKQWHNLVEIIPSITNGSTVVLSNYSESLVEYFAEMLRKRGLRDVLIVCISGDQSIESLNEDDMRRAGWVRAD